MSKKTKFDREQIIDKAKDLYWEKGFHATSMRNLQNVVDMHPGSIYTIFGSKEALFKATLVRYTELGLAQLALCREESATPVEALTVFVKNLVLKSQQDAPNCMCMLAKTVAELTSEHGDLLAEAKHSLTTMEEEFAKIIREAQDLGEIDKDKDAKHLARHVQVQISGLRIYAKANDGDAPLEQMIDDVFNHYPF
jgi:AcrR family transcriptional regulator